MLILKFMKHVVETFTVLSLIFLCFKLLSNKREYLTKIRFDKNFEIGAGKQFSKLIPNLVYDKTLKQKSEKKPEKLGFCSFSFLGFLLNFIFVKKL